MRRGIRAQRVLPALLVLSCLGATSAATASPATASAAVPNACTYNYDVDDYYRDTPFTLSGTASIVSDPPRYPAPTGTQADPGQTIRLAGAPLHVTLPGNLAEYGYRAGLLHDGTNTFPVKVWVAIAATNTRERVQVQGPLSLTATTVITVEPSDNSFVSATPFFFTDPVLADSTWTAVGGDVAFSQAGPGSLGVLPVGPGGANRTLAGSIVVHANNLGADGTRNFYMDCQPGAAQDVNPNDLAGPTFLPASATPFDTTIAGPRNVTCLSAVGRLAVGPDAHLPPTVTREIDPIGLSLSAAGNAPTATTGAPYTLAGAKAHVTIPAESVATLADHQDGGAPLIVSGKAYPLEMWVTLAGTNTVQGTQTVKVSGTYTLHSRVATPGWDAYDATIDLPDTTWTPAAAGPMAFSIAQPGTMPAITVNGSSATDPEGAPSATPYSVAPYGSAVLRAGTERNATTLDCVAGAVKVTAVAIPFSNLGSTGSPGRYTVLAHPSPPVFATATASAPVPPTQQEQPHVTPATTTTTPPPPPPPAALPAPLVAQVHPGAISTTSLRARAAMIDVQIRCDDARTSCSGVLSVRSALKLLVGKRRKVVTIAPDTRYTVAAGKRKTLKLKLAGQARTLLKRRRTMKVTITLKPSRGAAVTRTVTLRS